MTAVVSEVTESISLAEQQKQRAEAAAAGLEALVARLSVGDGFAEKFASSPLATLTAAGISLKKEGMEALMASDPDRFDSLTDSLFSLMDPNVLVSLVAPSCDPV